MSANLFLVAGRAEERSLSRVSTESTAEQLFVASGSKTLSTNDNSCKRFVHAEATRFHQRCIFFRFLHCVCFQRQVINVPNRARDDRRKTCSLHLRRLLFSLSTATEEEPRSASFNKFTFVNVNLRVCEAALVERWTSSKLCRTSTQSQSVSPSSDDNFPLFSHLYRPERK